MTELGWEAEGPLLARRKGQTRFQSPIEFFAIVGVREEDITQPAVFEEHHARLKVAIVATVLITRTKFGWLNCNS